MSESIAVERNTEVVAETLMTSAPDGNASEELRGARMLHLRSQQFLGSQNRIWMGADLDSWLREVPRE